MHSYQSHGYLREGDHIKSDWYWNSDFRCLIPSFYPLQQPQFQEYNTWYSEVATHVGTDHTWRGVTSVIRQQPVFQLDMTISCLEVRWQTKFENTVIIIYLSKRKKIMFKTLHTGYSAIRKIYVTCRLISQRIWNTSRDMFLCIRKFLICRKNYIRFMQHTVSCLNYSLLILLSIVSHILEDFQVFFWNSSRLDFKWNI